MLGALVRSCLCASPRSGGTFPLAAIAHWGATFLRPPRPPPMGGQTGQFLEYIKGPECRQTIAGFPPHEVQEFADWADKPCRLGCLTGSRTGRWKRQPPARL